MAPLFRLVALDIDGTLLRGDRSLSPRTRKAIARAQASGLLVTLVSGRGLTEMEFLARELNITIPIAGNNGAHLYDPATGEHLYRATLPQEVTAALLEDLHRLGIYHFCFRHGDVVLARRHWAQHVFHYYSIRKRKGFEKLTSYARWVHERLFHHRIRTEEKVSPRELTCITAIGNVDSFVEVASRYPELSIVGTTPYVDVVVNGVNKATGLQQIASRLQIPREAIVAVGDGYNDMEMISWAGLGVAMGNAVDKVLSAAHRTTLSNDEDGVAALIDELLGSGG